MRATNIFFLLSFINLDDNLYTFELYKFSSIALSLHNIITLNILLLFFFFFYFLNFKTFIRE